MPSKRADSDIKAAEAETAVEAQTVEVGTALAWINLAYAERRLLALDDVLARLQRVVGTTAIAVASGNARPAQTIAGHQAVATMQDRRSELVSNMARARHACPMDRGFRPRNRRADPRFCGGCSGLARQPRSPSHHPNDRCSGRPG
jgi:hypothetical protein